MRSVRAVGCLVLFLTLLASGGVETLGSSFCPDGCDCQATVECDWDISYVVDCFQVYECETVYPDFCDDAEAACWDLCQGSVNQTPVDFECDGQGTDCHAECVCDPFCWVCC